MFEGKNGLCLVVILHIIFRDELVRFVREQNNCKAQPWMATIENKNSDLNFSKFVLRELYGLRSKT
jgi:hypothetical protein